MIDDPDDPVHAEILKERARGRAPREIARARGMTVDEVRTVLDAAADRLFGGKQTRHNILVAAAQLDELIEGHFALAVASNDVAHSEQVRKLQERLASLLGWNAPQHQAVTLAHSVAPAAPHGDVELISAAIDRLRAEVPKASPTHDAG
jgi:hypothetical protein